MLNLNLNILGASNKPIVPIQPAPAPAPTTTTTTTVAPTTTIGPATFRNDPYSASLLFATPGNQFTTLGMSTDWSDVHADIAGTGTNWNVNSGSLGDPTYTNFAANGYVNSTKVAGTASLYNGTDSAFQFTSQNVTIECWVNVGDDSAGYRTMYSDYTPSNVPLSGLWAGMREDGRLRFITSVGSTETVIQSSVLGWGVNTWYHVAFVRNGSTYSIYRDGTLVASGGAAGNINSTTNPKRIMNYLNLAEGTVWIQDYKIYKGAAVYTSDFTPPQSMVI